MQIEIEIFPFQTGIEFFAAATVMELILLGDQIEIIIKSR